MNYMCRCHMLLNSEWQQEWDSQPSNKLHKIYPNVHHTPPLSSQSLYSVEEIQGRSIGGAPPGSWGSTCTKDGP